ncbi:MAG: hypothetical protein ACOZNI_17325 [Myxococcota bacterium]
MPPLAFHLVFRLQDDRVFAPSPAARRRLARVIARLAKAFPVLAWRVVDTHLHVLGLFSEAEVDELTRRLRIALARVHPGVPLLLSRRIAVANQWHLAEAFRYVLAQDEHHGVTSDPHQEGSCVLDLLGMRTLGIAVAGRVREHLPRVKREHLVAHLGVSALDEGLAPEHLAEATCAAFALPDLAGNVAEVVSARRAAAHAAREAGAPRIAEALGVTPRAVWRLLDGPAPAGVRAVRLQMGLRIARPE